MTDETKRIPLTLLSGFLGSGKTTLLNRILAEEHGERIAVVVNEFGDVGIDGSLVVGADEEVVELANGCVCCTVRGDLAETLGALLEKRKRKLIGRVSFDRIVVEGSGLASPGPIAQTLEIFPELGEEIELDGIVTLVRAGEIERQLAEHTEAGEQVGYADRILVNGCDVVDDQTVERSVAAARACNGVAPIKRTVRADVDLSEVLGVGTGRLRSWELEVADEDVNEHSHSAVSTVALRTDAVLDIHRLKMWLQFLSTRKTHAIMRLKGILRCQGFDHAVVVQGVYQYLELGPSDAAPPEESVLVLIGSHLDEEELLRGWEAARL